MMPQKSRAPSQVAKPKAAPQYDPALKTKTGEREARNRLDMAAINDGALPNQRVIVFKDKAALEAFLAKLGNGVRLTAT